MENLRDIVIQIVNSALIYQFYSAYFVIFTMNENILQKISLKQCIVKWKCWKDYTYYNTRILVWKIMQLNNTPSHKVNEFLAKNSTNLSNNYHIPLVWLQLDYFLLLNSNYCSKTSLRLAQKSVSRNKASYSRISKCLKKIWLQNFNVKIIKMYNAGKGMW